MIKIDPAVARQISEVYGSANRTVYAYGKDGDKQYQYTVPHPDSPVPESHPTQPDYKLLGAVNLLTGTVTPVGKSGGQEKANESQDRPIRITTMGVLRVVVLLAGWAIKLLALCILGVIAVAELLTSGGRRR